MDRPLESEYSDFNAKYVSLVSEDDILDVLERQRLILRALVRSIPSDKETFAYAPGKWTIREVLGHIIDCERVFGFRAVCIARGETQSLPGFDEQQYAASANAAACTVAELVEEFDLVRRANLVALKRLDDAAWRALGVANGRPVSTRAVAYIMAGHVRHHLDGLGERYGVDIGQGDLASIWPASRVDFEDQPWREMAHGARHKCIDRAGRRLRLLELTDGFIEQDWCGKAHTGYVLEGTLDLTFSGRSERVVAGEAFQMSALTEDRHKARAVTSVVRLFIVEDM